MTSKLIAIVIAIIAVIWIGSGFLGTPEPAAQTKQAQQEQPEDKPLQQVRVREFTAKSFADTVTITGRSQASRSVELRAEISGTLTEILKEEGEQVQTDDVIAALDVRDRAARKTEAQERVNQRRIEYNAAKKLADKGFNSKVRLAQSLADLEDAKAGLKEASLNVSNTKLTAPFDGIINTQSIDVGDYVDVGNVLFTIVDLDPIEFVGFVSERRVQDLKLGMDAHAELLDAQKITGKISFIAPAANEETRTFRVIMSATNTDFMLKEGMTAKLSIPVANKKAHEISPSILTLNAEGKIGVKIVNAEDIVEFTPIKILSDTPKSMWITGLNETARIITVGQEFVLENQKVEPVKADGEGLL